MAEQSPDSLGGENTYLGSLNKATGPQSLGDGRTFGGESPVDDAAFDDDMEVVDLSTRYTIEGVLGQGGMGKVLLATDNRLKRKVAIKRVLSNMAKSPTVVRRFMTEAQSIAALNHPNIVHVYDYGRDRFGPFLILEHVEGKSLLDRCQQGAIPWEEAISLACLLCDGLSRAHELGIIHRDLKPANVLLTKYGVPKLTDFGLARVETGDTGQTMSGAVLGTLDFMPPEQRKDSALVDSRSDLWSLAATLYQMVTGKSPRIIKFNDVPKALHEVLGKALEDSKDDRYQTALEFRDALRGSLKPATAAPEISSADLSAGECPKCHAKNEAARKFCRECASPLRVNCLSCNAEISVWEKVCGDCGAKQVDLIAQRQGELEQQRLSAESELRDGFFSKALTTAVDIRDQPDVRLQHLKSWADDFIPSIAVQQQQRESAAAASFAEAQTHGKSHDYVAADHSMQQIPDVLRTSAMRAYQQELTGTLGEIKQLKEQLRTRTTNQSFDGLMIIVDRYLELQPTSTHVLELRDALVKRDKRLASVRSEALTAARAFFSDQNYVACCNQLAELPTAAQTAETESLRAQSQSCLGRSTLLSEQIKSGLAAKKFTGLLALVEEYLRLNSRDAEMQTVRTKLFSRNEKLTTQTQEIVSKAEEFRASCRFDAASKQIRRIPESQQTEEIINLLAECDELSEAQTAARSKADALMMSERYKEALGEIQFIVQKLHNLGLTDSKFSSRQSACEAALALATSRAKQKRVLIAVSVAGLLLAVATVTVVRIRSSRTEASRLAEAVSVEASRVEVARVAEANRWAEVERLANTSRIEASRGAEGKQLLLSAIDEKQLDVVATLAPSAQNVLSPPYENSTGMSFKPLLGGPDGGFSVGVHEVTQSQYEQVMGSNPSEFKGANNPVEKVSWDDAVAFCAKLSSLPAEVAAGRVYRLPTEAEWEYACRAGTTTEYSFGDDASKLGEYAWFRDNSNGTTHAVGEKRPNAWGLYDMHGNVWEWCSDGEGSNRVDRGGSWSFAAAYCRSAIRYSIVPSNRTFNCGFRLALSSPSDQSPEAEQAK